MKRQVVFGIDIGGTNIKSGIVDASGSILHTDNTPTDARSGRDSLLDKLYAIAGRYKEIATAEGWEASGMGVATAGYVHAREGRIGYATSNLPGWTGVPLRANMERETGLPVALVNDAHAFAIGEAWIGAGKELGGFLCITLGTGVGGSWITPEGVPYYGRDGYAGGYGHIVIQHGGQPCNCGLSGCWEQYASVTALMRMAGEAGIGESETGGSAKKLFELARSGHPQALELIDRYAEYVAVGLTSLTHILNPSAVIIGGAVTAQGDFLFDRIRGSASQMMMPAYDPVAIIPAALGEHAGLAGAAKLAWLAGEGR
ncbi:ROK family protein [Paenibacillus ginsengarvi]|uniref:ROK family protein n=1 Tax=Paenibacillus ginsengarvi TaxID=400777 RepID=A0A3B0CLG5_9BACL|nr:ROK family protein [Paenibacillus ginsengarvi]RKN85810.1 ROK family protein [Paenibacillus ginsengarvi]